VEPDLAESWTLSPEGTIWTFKLKKGVQFHKASASLTAEDVKYSFERQINKAPGTRYGVNLDMIKFHRGRRPAPPSRSYSRPSTRSSCCAWWATSRATSSRRKRSRGHGEQFKWNPVGTGPFYFERHSPREKVVLKSLRQVPRRPAADRRGALVRRPRGRHQAHRPGEGTFDLLYPEAVTADVAEQVKRMGAVIDRRGPGGQERFYINMTKPPFDDIRVRKAFMHAIDRKAIKETMYPGGLARLATSCLPPGYFGHIPMQFPEYNPELAKKAPGRGGPIRTGSRSRTTSSANRSSIPRC